MELYFSVAMLFHVIYGLLVIVSAEIESCTLYTASVGGVGTTMSTSLQNHHHSSYSNAGNGGSSNHHSNSMLNSNFNSGGVGGNVDNNNNNGDTVLLCQIRTLHPDLDFDNLTSLVPISMESVTKLRLVCNDVLFFESVLDSIDLSGFSQLDELSIEKCKLKYVPGQFLSSLSRLTKLTIVTGNSEWASRSLEIAPKVIDSLNFRHLNLSFNHMWNLPDGLLCQAKLLSNLSLTHNLLSDIDDLGLPQKSHSQLILRQQQSEYVRNIGGSSSININSGASCLGDLKFLDLSYNTLRSLGSGKLASMRRIQELFVQHNWLEELDDDTFSGLRELRMLNLSSNRLVALPPRLFHRGNCCKFLKELHLQNNSLTTLSPELLDPLEELQILDVSMNSLVTIGPHYGLVRLVILNLSHNQLSSLSPATFQELYSLQVLALNNNKITTIMPNTFISLTNLHSLNLARNFLTTISANMFNGLYVLHKLILDYNQIDTVDSVAFRNCTSLKDLGLGGNNLSQVPEALPISLRTLDIGENNISTLHNSTFKGLGQLYGLRLVDNKIQGVLPRGLCDSIPRLRAFNVAQNLINKISSQAFTACPELRVLRLDSNKLDNLPSSLAVQLPSLLWMNVSENQLRRLDYSILPPKIEWLDVSHNKLESLGGGGINSFALNPAAAAVVASTATRSTNSTIISNTNNNKNNLHNHHVHLRVVDASHNLLTQVDHHAIPPSLEVLRLNYNLLTRIAPATLSRALRITRVELVGNQLETIALNSLRFPVLPAGRPLPEFLLGGNPFLCDCDMEWLTRITQQSTSLRSHPLVLDLDAIVCRLAYSRATTHVPLPEMKSQDFLCPYESHCFALCQCCEFDACDCAMTCPSNCTCYHDGPWSANIVECSSRRHTSVPLGLPMDSTEVYLDGNSIPSLKSHTFIGRKNCRVLYLNASGIQTIGNKSFNGLHSLQSLHLQENYLTTLNGFEFDQLVKLRSLFLHNNRLRVISNNTFLPLKALEILRLDGNLLVTFSVWQLSLNPYLVEIGLGGNEWNCGDCEFLHQLYSWMNDNSRKIVDINELRCTWNTTKLVGPYLMNYNSTCGSSWDLIQGSFDFGHLSTLPLVLTMVALMIFILLIVAAVYLFCTDNFKLCMFTHLGIRLGCSDDFGSSHSGGHHQQHDEHPFHDYLCHSCPCYCFPCGCGSSDDKGAKLNKLDEDKSYDAYIIYSEKDEEFVVDKIADELEANDNYRLFLHHRDLINETGDLKQMMLGAVESAKCIVVIVSRNFLQGEEWLTGAFHEVINRAVQQQSFNNSSSASGGRNSNNSSPWTGKSILFILTEAIDVTEMSSSESFRSLFNSRKIKRRTLKWTERKFFSKLKFLLPDPIARYHSNITSNTTTTSASSSADTPAKHHHQQQPHSQHHHRGGGIGGGEQERDETSPPINMHQGTLNMNNMMMDQTSKLWLYAPTSFVALPPPKYNQHQQHQNIQSPSQGIHRMGSSNPLPPPPPIPKSPPSNSTACIMMDHHHDIDPSSSGGETTTATTTMNTTSSSSFYGHGHSGGGSGNTVVGSGYSYQTSAPPSHLPKSPVPPSKSTGNGRASGNVAGSKSHVNGGESYLSLDGEHVYSSLDPPSPQSYPPLVPVQQLGSNYTINQHSINLPNGYTYSPSPRPQPQWHPYPSHSPPRPVPSIPGKPNHHSVGGTGGSSSKARKTGTSSVSSNGGKSSNETVQTYLV